METNFTKGEWVGITVTTPNGFFERVTIKDGESICNVTTRNSKRAKANAKLIAAAPDLLEALKLMVARAEFKDNNNGIAICLAKSAIKKATE